MTYAEHLHSLPDGWRERALRNCRCHTRTSDGTLSEALNGAFTWSPTPEGGDAWRVLCERYSDLRRGHRPPRYPVVGGRNA